jgi:phosphoenolpyruvate-protein kinase (PTS system EI component)
MAADRGNSRVADLVDPLQPPVIAAIARIAEAAQVARIWVGVCGEIAGEPLVTPLLLGLGITELSMSAPAIGAVKAVIRRIEHAAAVDFAHYLMTLPDARAVRAALQRFAEQR